MFGMNFPIPCSGFSAPVRVSSDQERSVAVERLQYVASLKGMDLAGGF